MVNPPVRQREVPVQERLPRQAIPAPARRRQRRRVRGEERLRLCLRLALPLAVHVHRVGGGGRCRRGRSGGAHEQRQHRLLVRRRPTRRPQKRHCRRQLPAAAVRPLPVSPGGEEQQLPFGAQHRRLHHTPRVHRRQRRDEHHQGLCCGGRFCCCRARRLLLLLAEEGQRSRQHRLQRSPPPGGGQREQRIQGVRERVGVIGGRRGEQRPHPLQQRRDHVAHRRLRLGLSRAAAGPAGVRAAT